MSSVSPFARAHVRRMVFAAPTKHVECNTFCPPRQKSILFSPFCFAFAFNAVYFFFATKSTRYRVNGTHSEQNTKPWPRRKNWRIKAPLGIAENKKATTMSRQKRLFPCVCHSLLYIPSTYVSYNHTCTLNASDFSWQLERSSRVLNVLDWNAECEQRLPTTQAAGTSFSFFPLSIAWIFMLVHKTAYRRRHTRSLACPSNFYMFSRTATDTFFFVRRFVAGLFFYDVCTVKWWNNFLDSIRRAVFFPLIKSNILPFCCVIIRCLCRCWVEGVGRSEKNDAHFEKLTVFFT